ncbi:hypothetical protein [Asticcacaulis sp. YBE204]|uniref:hypothetical protein n=1 Tax=Asticcacaulis sp. YBE204 TaxID=1282363 RepID=UPI0003C3D109|nr:hypothetical protein [Asticcacaulis sp. YBE204]ESQ78797.1 hypothetical protein AEYBE204_12500 [Asticcacaulis sp. YBE204]
MSAALILVVALAATQPNAKTDEMIDKSGTCYNVFTRGLIDQADAATRDRLVGLQTKARAAHAQATGKTGEALTVSLSEWDGRLREKMKTGLSLDQYLMICTRVFGAP